MRPDRLPVARIAAVGGALKPMRRSRASGQPGRAALIPRRDLEHRGTVEIAMHLGRNLLLWHHRFDRRASQRVRQRCLHDGMERPSRLRGQSRRGAGTTWLSTPGTVPSATPASQTPRAKHRESKRRSLQDGVGMSDCATPGAGPDPHDISTAPVIGGAQSPTTGRRRRPRPRPRWLPRCGTRPRAQGCR